jgi:iron complex outermembrane receptor protein
LTLIVHILLLFTALANEPSSDSQPEGEVREDEVVVEGELSRSDDVTAESSAQVTVIEVGEQAASESIAEIVERSAGVHIRRLGGLGDFSSVSIRGSTWRQVQVYIDGIPLNPDGISSVNLSELPTGALSRIEVWRGFGNLTTQLKLFRKFRYKKTSQISNHK